MISFADIANVGDLIKAYDVPPMDGMPERFVVGVVVAKGRVFQNYREDRCLFLGEGYTIDIIGGDKKSVHARGRIGSEAFVPYHIEHADHHNRVSLVMDATQLKEARTLLLESDEQVTYSNRVE